MLERVAQRASAPSGSTELALARLTKPLQRKLTIGAVDDPLERDADRIAEQITQDSHAAPSHMAATNVLSRKCACGSSSTGSGSHTPTYSSRFAAADPSLSRHRLVTSRDR